MGRRVGQVLVAVGVTIAVVAAFALAASHGVRDTRSVRDAAPELLEMSSVRDAVADELGRAIAELYAPIVVRQETLAGAADRMVSNGYVVDDFQLALAEAHERWVEDGTHLEVQLDAAVATQTALTALRDVDPGVADAFPPDGIVRPAPVLLPIDTTLGRIADLDSAAPLALLGGLLCIVVGAAVDRRRSNTLKNLARGLCTAGLVALLAAFVLPLSLLRDLSPVVGVLGAVAGQHVPVLVGAAVVALVIGLSLHASADRIVAEVSRTVSRSARAKKAEAPVPSGAKLSRRGADKARSEAIDAFFTPPERQRAMAGDDAEGDEDEQGIGPGHGDLELPELVEAADGDAGDGDEPGDGDGAPRPPAPLTPEQERAEALAAERKEALERIDGTRSRYRTHLRR